MPQIIVRYSGWSITPQEIIDLGDSIRPLIAEATSTEERKLTKDDIEWTPEPNHEASLGINFSMELMTIGFPDRKAKMIRAAMVELKKKITALPEFPRSIDPKQPFLWVIFTDPDGVYV